MGIRPTGSVHEALRPQLVEIDLTSETIRRVPIDVPRHGPDALDQELTSACRGPDGSLWQAAHTALLAIDPVSLEVVRTWSHPALHNVHSVTPAPEGGFTVTATSTDRILQLDANGKLTRTIALTRRRFPRDDLRGLDHDAFKPHRFHPNHAVWVGGTLWVTCLLTRECRPVHGPGTAIALPEAMPHDGRLRQGWLWFTQVTGRIVAVDPTTGARTVDLDLAALTDEPRMLGWCRGIEVVDDRLYVGFTMLRRPRHREVLRVLWRGLRGEKLPTRVLEVDWRRGEVLRSFVLGNAAGGTIYAVTAYPDSTRRTADR